MYVVYLNADVLKNLCTLWTKTMCTYMCGSDNTDFVRIIQKKVVYSRLAEFHGSAPR